jgi:hypothetical protein
MRERSRETITTYESPVLAKPLFDPAMVEGSKGNRRFPDPPCTDESDGFEIFGESDDLLD